MTTTNLHPALETTPNAFGLLIEALWAGEIGEREFIAQASQTGVSVAQIEHQIIELKTADGVL